ncbi:type VI immunity family protein [Melittangium boletus]|nr:type VI immunity family protein [Melittangium boletus]
MEKRGYATRLLLNGGASSRNGYELSYRARIPRRASSRASVSLLCATLPTEYIEEHGERRVRELAMEMGSMLRFASGHAGLALRLYWPLCDDARRARYPGWSVCPSESDEQWRGTRLDGVHWLNFLGPPVLDELGGVHSLRARLRSSQTSVQELGGRRAVVSLGEWPELGGFFIGDVLPAYREFARELEPWLAPLQ